MTRRYDPICWLGFMLLAITSADARAQTGAVIPLPGEDKAEIEKYLGPGVIGAPVAAPPIPHGIEFYGLREATWHGTLREKDGKAPRDIRYAVSRVGNEADASWRGSVGSTVRFIETTNEGHIQLTSEVDNDQGVVSRFSPSQPHVRSGMKPGESQQVDIDVKVYDLKRPDHLEHKGELSLTFSYIGAYQVTVPAGTYEAVLLKWHYKGKVGPARVENTQYRLVAEGVGPVAFVDMKSISAMLIYNDKAKMGFVLERVE